MDEDARSDIIMAMDNSPGKCLQELGLFKTTSLPVVLGSSAVTSSTHSSTAAGTLVPGSVDQGCVSVPCSSPAPSFGSTPSFGAAIGTPLFGAANAAPSFGAPGFGFAAASSGFPPGTYGFGGPIVSQPSGQAADEVPQRSVLHKTLKYVCQPF